MSSTESVAPSPTEKAEAKKKIGTPYFESLKAEGFSPEFDADGDIKFKFQAFTFYILPDVSDESYLRLCFPGFWSFQEKKRPKVLAIINDLNRSIKLASRLLKNSAIA